MPSAADVLPLPGPVWTMTSPFSTVFAATFFACAAWIFFIFALCSASLRSEEHTSELQSLMRISYAVFCLKETTNYTDYDKHDHDANAHHMKLIKYHKQIRHH